MSETAKFVIHATDGLTWRYYPSGRIIAQDSQGIIRETGLPSDTAAEIGQNRISRREGQTALIAGILAELELENSPTAQALAQQAVVDGKVIATKELVTLAELQWQREREKPKTPGITIPYPIFEQFFPAEVQQGIMAAIDARSKKLSN